MKTKKTYIAPEVSVTEIKTDDVIMTSLANANFTGKAIQYGEIKGIDLNE